MLMRIQATSFESLDDECRNALIDIANIDLLNWLTKYKYLYSYSSIKPVGKPSIADCFENGVFYEHVSRFHSIYERIDNSFESQVEIQEF